MRTRSWWVSNVAMKNAASTTTPERCEANALECFRLSQAATDEEAQRTFWELAVSWRQLAGLIERQKKKDA